ncbi:hypothetical protein ACOMHN_012327 [Nucella lapillus]
MSEGRKVHSSCRASLGLSFPICGASPPLLLLLLLFLKGCDAGTLYLNGLERHSCQNLHKQQRNSSGGDGGGGALSDIMYRTVWRGYEAAVRPLCVGGSPSSTSTVVLGIALRQLQQLDEPKQILSTNLWLRVMWSECRLVWNADRWNISRLIVPYASIWTPDLTLYDNADSGMSGLQGYRLSITSKGEVLQQVPVVLNSLCQLDVSRFPFDTQTCNLTFGSWAYHGLELNLTSSEHAVDLSSYVTHGEWEVLSFTAVRIEPYFSGLPYPQVVFTLVLRRRHLFYIFSMMFPCALIQLMASLAFLLPCETNEKVGLEITVLLSLAVMQLVIMDMIPASSETLPIIGLYFTLAMIVVSVSCMMTVVVLAIHFPHRHRPLPPWAIAILRSRVALVFGVDINAEQESLKQAAAKAEAYQAADPSTTDHRKSMTGANGHASGSSDVNRAALFNICQDPAAPKPSNDVINPYDVINPCDVTNPCDVSLDDSYVSYSYSVEGERGRRHTYRPRSADACLMALCAGDRRPQGGFPGILEHPRGKELPETLEHRRCGEMWEMLERGEEMPRAMEQSQGGGGRDLGGKLEHTGVQETAEGMMAATALREEGEEKTCETLNNQSRRETSWKSLAQPKRQEPQEMLERQQQQQQQKDAAEESLEPPTLQPQNPDTKPLHPTPSKEPPRPIQEHPLRERPAKPERTQPHGDDPSQPLPPPPPPPTSPPPELEEIMDLCRKILGCMKGEKKPPADPQEKLTKKMSRREWEMMAQLLDRVFLLVFTLLTVVMFAYVYGTIV